jgi:hypothetical protein
MCAMTVIHSGKSCCEDNCEGLQRAYAFAPQTLYIFLPLFAPSGMKPDSTVTPFILVHIRSHKQA